MIRTSISAFFILACIHTLNPGWGFEVLWEHRFGVGIPDSSITAADITGDGNIELAFTTTTGRLVVCDLSGKELWSVPTREVICHPPTIADLFPGGGQEILTVDRTGMIRCFSSEGEELWIHSLPSGLVWNQTTLVAVDLDADGRIEVLAGGQDGSFLCLDRLGNQVWKYDVSGGFSCPPAVADLDGDGRLEVLLTSGAEQLVALDSTGRELWKSDLGCVNHSGPTLVDLKSTGSLDILVGGEDGILKCYSAEGKTIWSHKIGDREIDSTIAVGNLVEGGNLEIVCIDLEGNLVCVNAHGRELWRQKLPTRARRPPSIADFTGDGKMEILANGYFSNFHLFSGEGEELEKVPGFSTNGGATLVHIEGRLAAVIPGGDGNVRCITWQADAPTTPSPIEWGMYRLDAAQTGSLQSRSLKTATAEDEGRDRSESVDRLAALQPNVHEAIEISKKLRSDLGKFDASSPALALLEIDLIDLRESLNAAIENESEGSIVPLLALNRATVRALENAETAFGEAESAAAKLEASGPAPFLMWPTNPWRQQVTRIHEETESFLNMEKVRLEMYRNETESAAFNLLNVQQNPVAVQIKVQAAAESDSIPVTTVFEVVSVPTEVEDFSDDALVELNKGNLIHLGPGETRQIFLNFAAREALAGDHAYTLHATPLLSRVPAATAAITVQVHSLDIAEGTAPHLCMWGYVHNSPIKEFPEEAWEDRIAHGNNTITVTGKDLPTGVYDASGEFKEPLDWKPLGEFVDAQPGIEFLLLLHAAVVRPEKEGLSQEAHEKAVKQWTTEAVAYLAEKGFGYDRFAYYPVDEPGLNPGLVDLFIDYAKEFRKADPNFLIYTDPVDGANLADIERMAPYVDIWCPNRNGFLLESDDPRLDVMKEHGKLLWTYECLHHAKHRPPLQYYRGYAWLSALRGCTGFGFWSYCTSQDDPWFYPEKSLHDYLLVYPGKGIVTSRRWEAVRDGVEDLRAVALLRKRTAETGKREVEEALHEAMEELGEFCLRPNGTGDFSTQGVKWLTPELVDGEYSAYQKHRARIAELTPLSPQP